MTSTTIVDQSRFESDMDAALLKAAEWQDFSATHDLLEEANRIRKDAQVAYDAAVEAGRKAGYEAGFAAGLERLDQAVQAAEAERKRFCSTHEDVLLETVFGLLARVVPDLDRADWVEPLLRSALGDLGDYSSIRIRVAPESLDAARGLIESETVAMPGRRVQVHADPALEGSSCVLETGDGVIRLGLGRQLGIMERALQTTFRGR